MSRNLKIIIVLKLILWSIIFYTGYTIYKWFMDNHNNEVLINSINNLVIINNDKDIINVDTTKIEYINENIKGWIKVEGTNINYPFLQTDNNDYYLNHSIDNSNNKAGWIFLDYRNNIDELNKNTIIYGHNRLNNTMFGDLKKTLNTNWINNQDNHYIKLSTNKENTLWKIFSIYTIDKTSDYLDINFNDEEYEEFIELITNRSIHNFDDKPSRDDYIITLSTCHNDNERMVVHAKLIEKEIKE